MARSRPVSLRSRLAPASCALALALAPATAARGAVELLHSFDPEKGAPVAALTEIAPGTFVGTAQTGGALGLGSVFRIADDGAGGWSFENLHSFAGPDGATPQGALLAASDGALYGTTSTGGASGVGVVYSGALFRIDAGGGFTLLHSFAGADGARPVAGLIEASDGAFYGTTWGGGAAGLGTVFRTDASGAVTVLHSFGGADGARPAASLVEASDGRLYGTTSAGGAHGQGALFRIEPTGAGFTLLRSLQGADGTAPYAALVEQGGQLYGVCSGGGASGGGTIFAFAVGATERPASAPLAADAPEDVALTVLHDFAPADGTGPRAALAAGPGGSFYGTTRDGGAAGGGTAFRFDAGGGLLVLHAFALPEGIAPQAPLVPGADGRLHGVARAGGSLGHGTVFALDTGGALETVHDFGRAAADGAGPAAPLAVASDGNLYGTTSAGGAANAGTAFRVDPATGATTTLHSFVASEGTRPFGGLVEVAGGNLFGTTQMGGTYGTGSVFEMTPAGAVTLRHAFRFSEGTSPVAGLTVAADGRLYGTAPMGGPSHAGSVFSVDGSGALVVHHAFADADGAAPRAPLVEAAGGVLYGTTSAGGANQAGTLFSYDGSLTVRHEFAGADGAAPRAGLVAAADGWLYGSAAEGGAFGLGTLFRADAAGTFELLHSFSGADGARPAAGLVEGADGALYGTTEDGGAAGLGVVFRVPPGGPVAVVHEFGGADGAHPRAGLARAGDGALYGTTFAGGAYGAGAVFRLSPLRVDIVPQGPTTFCAPGSVRLDAVARGGSGVYTAYQWYRDGLAVAGETSVSLLASSGGSYTVTVTDSSPATSDPSTPVAVTAAIPATAQVGGGGLISVGNTVDVFADLTGTPPWSLTWSDGATQTGIAASPASRAVSPPATATYTATAVAGAEGCPGTTSGSALVTVTTTRLLSVTTVPKQTRGGTTTTQNHVDLSAGDWTADAAVALSSSNPAVATVPATAVVPAGSQTVRFPITTFPVATDTTVTIRASWAGTTVTDTLTVRATLNRIPSWTR